MDVPEAEESELRIATSIAVPAARAVGVVNYHGRGQRPSTDQTDSAAQRPNLITNVATTDASVPDVTMTEPIHRMLNPRGLLPDEHYLDSGYPSAELMSESLADSGITLITPVLADHSPQGKAGAGFDRAAFTIDFDREQATTCPQGQTSSSTEPDHPARHRHDRDHFRDRHVRAVSAPAAVPTSRTQRRQLTVHPRAVHEAQRAARADQETQNWQAKYALRAGVEGTIRHGIAVTDLRHTRYLSLAKTHLEHVFSAEHVQVDRRVHRVEHPVCEPA